MLGNIYHRENIACYKHTDCTKSGKSAKTISVLLKISFTILLQTVIEKRPHFSIMDCGTGVTFCKRRTLFESFNLSWEKKLIMSSITSSKLLSVIHRGIKAALFLLGIYLQSVIPLHNADVFWSCLCRHMQSIPCPVVFLWAYRYIDMHTHASMHIDI